MKDVLPIILEHLVVAQHWSRLFLTFLTPSCNCCSSGLAHFPYLNPFLRFFLVVFLIYDPCKPQYCSRHVSESITKPLTSNSTHTFTSPELHYQAYMICSPSQHCDFDQQCWFSFCGPQDQVCIQYSAGDIPWKTHLRDRTHLFSPFQPWHQEQR